MVVFSGGGTGGHLYPALAIADALRARRPDVRAVFVGAERGIEARILPEREKDFHLLPVRGMDRGSRISALWAAPALLRSVLAARRLLAGLRPEVVVVTRGYASAPAGLVAGLTSVPLVIQEQNSIPGAATMMLSRWAETIHIAFPEAADHLPAPVRGRVTLSGNPIRASSPQDPRQAREQFGLPADAVVALVVGGSQGAMALNDLVVEGVCEVVDGRLERPDTLHLLWATGTSHHEAVTDSLSESGGPHWVHALPYINDMPSALAAADITVSRAGAIFTAERLNAGLPALLVPLPTAAANHQAHNAESLADAGAAIVLHQAGLTGTALFTEIARLAMDDDARRRMSAAANELARPNAADDIARSIEALFADEAST